MKSSFRILILLIIFPILIFGQTDGDSLIIHQLDSLINQTKNLSKTGNFKEALLYGEKAINLAESKLTENHPKLTGCYTELGKVHFYLGNYTKTESYLLKSLNINRVIYGNEHIQCGYSLNNLGILCDKIDQQEKSVSYFLESLKIKKKVLGDQHSSYSSTLSNLGSVYRVLDRYEEAEAALTEALETTKNSKGTDNLNYAKNQHNLGNLYLDMGLYNKAKSQLLESLSTKEKVAGRNNSDFASTLKSLGVTLRSMGKYEEAETVYFELMDIYEKILGKEHFEYASALTNTAILYRFMGRYKEAEDFFLQASNIIEKTISKNHSSFAKNTTGLGRLYLKIGNITAAENNFRLALEYWEKNYGKKYSHTLETKSELGIIFWKTQRIKKATQYFLDEFQYFLEFIENAAKHSSLRELDKFQIKYQKPFDRFFSFAQLYGNIEHQLYERAYSNILFNKGYLLDNRLKIQKAIKTMDNSTLSIYYEWLSTQRRLAKKFSQPIKRRDGLEKLEEHSNALEKVLVKNVAGLSKTKKKTTWKNIEQQLKHKEAAIEFVKYRYYNPELTDSIFYSALVLRPGYSHPKMILLFEESSLALLVNKENSRKLDYVDQLYTFNRRGAKLVKGDKKSLYDLIWAPLDSLLKGVERVYYSPTGLLHRLTLPAIPIDEEHNLSDQFELYNLGNTRQILFRDEAQVNAKGGDAIIFGGVQYEMDSTAITKANNHWLQQDSLGLDKVAFENTISTRGEDWNYLKWTEQEAREVKELLEDSSIEVNLQMGYEATEESFRQIGIDKPSPRILHLATHGYFFPDPEEKYDDEFMGMDDQTGFRVSENPMIRSGLIMAGANRVWSGDKPLDGYEDGILTAYEISQMDLSNTELVVLSACETGFGDIEGNEGVYGLQRAFKIAGAKYIIMSLWQVPDYQTKELMTTFYQEWLGGKEIPKAFKSAQQQMKEKYQNPYFWAGFVLVE